MYHGISPWLSDTFDSKCIKDLQSERETELKNTRETKDGRIYFINRKKL